MLWASSLSPAHHLGDAVGRFWGPRAPEVLSGSPSCALPMHGEPAGAEPGSVRAQSPCSQLAPLFGKGYPALPM